MYTIQLSKKCKNGHCSFSDNITGGTILYKFVQTRTQYGYDLWDNLKWGTAHGNEVLNMCTWTLARGESLVDPECRESSTRFIETKKFICYPCFYILGQVLDTSEETEDAETWDSDVEVPSRGPSRAGTICGASAKFDAAHSDITSYSRLDNAAFRTSTWHNVDEKWLSQRHSN